MGEETTELIIESKDNTTELFKNESVDLLFHYLILLEAKNVSLDEIIEVLKKGTSDVSIFHRVIIHSYRKSIWSDAYKYLFCDKETILYLYP